MDDLIETALKRFKLAEDAEQQIRQDALDDLKFSIGDQWPQNIKLARDIDMQPCLTINKMPASIRQVTNDARQNRPQIRIVPTDDSTEEVAEILEGLMRYIQVSSNADIAYDTAMDFMVRMGFGYWRIITEYTNEKSFDQDIKIKPIKNPFTVYLDPTHDEPEDKEWGFITSDMPVEEYKRKYPKSDAANQPLSSIGDNSPGWASEDTIRVCEYFYMDKEYKTIHQTPDGKTHHDDDLPEGYSVDKELMTTPTGPMKVKSRETVINKLKWCLINAVEVLEKQDLPGKYIPIVPLYGEDIDVDGTRNLIGMTRDAKDPQRIYNYWSSAMTQAIALAPKAPFIMAGGQIEGYEQFWKTANTKSHSHLPYNPMDLNGHLVPAPQRQVAEPPVQAMAHAIGQASDDIKATTGIYDASLGEQGTEISGKAINARQRQGNISTFHYIDNLSRSLRYTGCVIEDLIPFYYDGQRIIRIVHEDGTTESVKVNGPSGQKDMSGVDKVFDLTTGEYDVVVETGPSYNTKKEETQQAMTQAIQAYPQLMQVAGDLIVEAFDWPNAQVIAERLHAALPPQLQNPPENVDPKTQQMLQQQHQMVGQLTQAVHTLQDKLDSKTAELASKEKIAEMNNEAMIVAAALKAETSNNMGLLNAELEHLRAENGQKQDLALAQMKQTALANTPQPNAGLAAGEGSNND